MNKIVSAKDQHQQQGFVLIVSLLVLLVITMIGVTALSTATLEGRMAYNQQHAMYAFQAAESAIEDTVRASNPQAPGYDIATDPIITSSFYPSMQSYSAPLTNAEITATVTVSQVNNGAICPGFSLELYSCPTFEMDTRVTIDKSNATANHIQGVLRLMPRSL